MVYIPRINDEWRKIMKNDFIKRVLIKTRKKLLTPKDILIGIVIAIIITQGEYCINYIYSFIQYPQIDRFFGLIVLCICLLLHVLLAVFLDYLL
jgi:hypothetical protein